MQLLDIPTLVLVTVAVTALAGTLFGMLWLQARSETSYALWALAHGLGTVGCTLLALRNVVPDVVSIMVANAVICAGYGVLWAGLRYFFRLPPQPFWTLFGTMVWLIACAEPSIYQSVTARIVVLSVIVSGYSFATAFDAWRGYRQEPLRSGYVIILLHLLHGLAFLLRSPLAIFEPVGLAQGMPASPWFGVLSFTTMINVIAIGYLYMVMAKERAEAGLRAAATVDPLTSVSNRGAFVDATVALMRRRRRGGVLLLADLDHFKRINDRFGHLAGDHALIRFCEITRAELPPGALIGRLGGEEFGVFLPEADPAVGRAVAEQLRAAVAATAIVYHGDRLPVTVSIGLAECGPDADFGVLFAAADRALYAAKSEGRDRVASSIGKMAMVEAMVEPGPSPAAASAEAPAVPPGPGRAAISRLAG